MEDKEASAEKGEEKEEEEAAAAAAAVAAAAAAAEAMVDGKNFSRDVSLAVNGIDMEGMTTDDDDEEADSPFNHSLAHNIDQFFVINPIINKDVQIPARSSVISSNSPAHQPVTEIRVPARDSPAEPARSAPNASTRSPLRRSRAWEMYSGKKFKLIEVSFRVAEAVFCLLAFSVMASNHQTGTELGTKIPFDAKFSNFQAYSYLLAMNVLGFVYSAAQLIMLKVNSKHKFSYSPSVGWTIGTFICDQVLAFLLFSASTSAATVSVLSRNGAGSIWPSMCTVWQVKTFCIQAESAVGLSFLASFCAIVVALLSGNRLFRSIR